MLRPLRNVLRRRGLWPEAWLTNPCLGELPAEVVRDERLQAIWDGLDPAYVWDSHAHLVGIGDGNSGIRVHRDLVHPLKR